MTTCFASKGLKMQLTCASCFNPLPALRRRAAPSGDIAERVAARQVQLSYLEYFNKSFIERALTCALRFPSPSSPSPYGGPVAAMLPKASPPGGQIIQGGFLRFFTGMSVS